MNDSYTEPVVGAGLLDEIHHGFAGFFNEHAVKVKLPHYHPAAAPQIARNVGPHFGTAEGKTVFAFQKFHGIIFVGKGFGKHRFFVGHRLTRHGLRRLLFGGDAFLGA